MLDNHKCSCIYCGTKDDLSESDIIPDALTNARITNKNVCRVEHNNRFSDLFESKVIKALSFICNELDIKSSKGKKYASYEANVKIQGVEYDVSMSSEMELFNGRVLKSTDKKYLMSSLEKVSKIAKDPSKVQVIDINNSVIEKKVNINLEIYFSEEMFRLVSKIAFEWYCAKNNVTGYHDEFKEIISFIINGIGKNLVSILQNDELYKFINEEVNLGSHCLFAFEDEKHRVNVIVSLFGIVMYKVIVANHIPKFCMNNLLYQELCTDSSRKEVIESSLEGAERSFFEYLTNQDNSFSKKLSNEIKVVVKKQGQGINEYIFLLNAIKCFKDIKDETISPNEKVTSIICNNIYRIISESLLSKKSIKRFVKEHFEEGHEPIKLNPTSSNKKSTFMFYILMLIGKRNFSNIDDKKLQQIAREALNMDRKNEIIITNELEVKLKEEILSTPKYSSLLEKGATIIREWKD